ncbi:MAG: hypothetical protein ABIH50_02725 [bacterium]
MTSEDKIILIRLIIFVGFILAIIFHQGLMRLLNLNIYPYNTFNHFIVTFAQISFGYRMILLFIPMFLFINDGNTGKYSRYYAILFALLLIPKNYYYFYADVAIMSIINPILMIVFMVMIMVEELKKVGMPQCKNTGH